VTSGMCLGSSHQPLFSIAHDCLLPLPLGPRPQEKGKRLVFASGQELNWRPTQYKVKGCLASARRKRNFRIV
jgi:hypothetical protein